MNIVLKLEKDCIITTNILPEHLNLIFGILTQKLKLVENNFTGGGGYTN